jgi:hypothetical protein
VPVSTLVSHTLTPSSHTFPPTKLQGTFAFIIISTKFLTIPNIIPLYHKDTDTRLTWCHPYHIINNLFDSYNYPQSTSFAMNNNILEDAAGSNEPFVHAADFHDPHPNLGFDDEDGSELTATAVGSPTAVIPEMASSAATAVASPAAVVLEMASPAAVAVIPEMALPSSPFDTFITLLFRMPMGGMPMPSSAAAPKFNGHNLCNFLEDYEMAAENANWTPQQKCQHIHKYCNQKTCNLVSMLKPREEGDWEATVKLLHKWYIGDECSDKYSCNSLEHFIA